MLKDWRGPMLRQCTRGEHIPSNLKSLCSLSRLYAISWKGAGETASSTWDQGRVLSIENQADTRGNRGQHRAGQFSWHDEGRPDSVASAVKDRHASRRRPVSTSTFSRIVLKIWICGWSRDARDPATAYLLTGSVETTHTRFEAEVSSTAVMSMFEVREARLSPEKVQFWPTPRS